MKKKNETTRHIRIVGTGSCVPTTKQTNTAFQKNELYTPEGKIEEKPIKTIIQDFENLTEIHDRLYVSNNKVASDIGYEAALDAIVSSKINKETIDFIIVAQNYGDIRFDNRKSDQVPCLAARIKNKLGIKNPYCGTFDVNAGCPGWVEAMMIASLRIKGGISSRILVIGTETLSRVCDPHDRNALLFADGAGAVILEVTESKTPTGVLSYVTRTDANKHDLIVNGKSNKKDYAGNNWFIKMHGKGVYRYAIDVVPKAIKKALDKAGMTLRDIKIFCLHQANGKMIKDIFRLTLEEYGIKARVENITKTDKLYFFNENDLEKNLHPEVWKTLISKYGKKEEYELNEVASVILPMNVSSFGNSSIATIPTILDRILKGLMPGYKINRGDIIIFAAVGAGMIANVIVCKY